MQRWKRGNSLELSVRHSFDKDQQEVERDQCPNRGNTRAHTRPHTMGVWRTQTCQVSCQDKVGSGDQEVPSQTVLYTSAS